MEIDNTELNGLLLFKELIKDGCKWDGELFTRKYSEALRYDLDIEERVLKTLSHFTEGTDYRIEKQYLMIYVA
jgi:hypothetical protein